MRPITLSMGAMLLLTSAFLFGCGSGPRLYHVKGTITYKGAPVPAGVIYFDPDIANNNDGPQGFAYIKDGAFDTAAKNSQGIIGKSYLVRIRGFDGKPASELPMGQPLFQEYQQVVDFPLENTKRDFQVVDK